MNVRYSKIVQRKMQKLKEYLDKEYSNVNSSEILEKMVVALDNLGSMSAPGVSIRERFGIDTDYRMFICKKNIFILDVVNNEIVIKQMFNEKEDFIYKLFKIPMRSNESIDFWGE